MHYTVTKGHIAIYYIMFKFKMALFFGMYLCGITVSHTLLLIYS